MPDRMSSSLVFGRLPVRSVNRARSTDMSWETLATESFGSPVNRLFKKTFPGALAHAKLLVRGTQITVAMLLRLMESP